MAVSLPSAPEGEDRMTSFTTVQTAAMQRALRAAASPDTPTGPNPRVGCVILSPDGDVLAEGHHRGAGSAHAEVDALANLAATGASARGASVMVTLEPCTMCAGAIVLARVARLVLGAWEPRTGACGSVRDVVRDTRANHQVEVRAGLRAQESHALLTDFFSDRR